MVYLGKYWNRKTFYIDLNEDYEKQLPHSNWVCFAIANKKPNDEILSKFIRTCIKKDLFEFKGFGLFGGYLHLSFDLEVTKMEIDENHSEIQIMTTGEDGEDVTDFTDAFWECYGATCLPDRANYKNIKIICISFDNINYSDKLQDLIRQFNNKMLP